MAKISLHTLLNRAEEQFTSGKYESALSTYGLLLKEYPTDSDAQIGVVLCDIGMESTEEAQALYDYYQIIKKEQENANEVMANLLSTLDTTKEQINELLSSNTESIEYKDGISYQDFINFIDKRGDFKQAFEDVMFSTRVMLKNKEEYILFINTLLNRGQYELALQFLDGSGSSFGQDQEIYALYKKLKKEK